jgi:hypothetical protein
VKGDTLTITVEGLTKNRVPASASNYEGFNFLTALFNLILLLVSLIEAVTGLGADDPA